MRQIIKAWASKRQAEEARETLQPKSRDQVNF